MNNDLKKLLLCLKWDIDNIENLNDKRDHLSGRVADIQEQVENCSIPLVSNPFNASEFEYSEIIKGKGKEYNYVSNKIHYFVNGELVKILNQ